MQFNHDTLIGVHLAEDLVNLEVERRWSETAVEAALTRGLVRFDRLGADELALLHDWARRLQKAFRAPDASARREAVNGLLDDGARRVHLAEHDGLPPHLHFAEPDADMVQRVKAMTAGGVAVFVADAGIERIGACPRPGCGRAFADTSRNGRRVYCSARCGNASAVQRYRERR